MERALSAKSATTYMHFIYKMSIGDLPFYIGMSMRPEQRYRDHYFDTLSACYNINRFILDDRGEIANMKIIAAIKGRINARELERHYITLYSEHYYLINNEIWPHHLRSIGRNTGITNSKRLWPYYAEIREQVQSWENKMANRMVTF